MGLLILSDKCATPTYISITPMINIIKPIKPINNIIPIKPRIAPIRPIFLASLILILVVSLASGYSLGGFDGSVEAIIHTSIDLYDLDYI